MTTIRQIPWTEQPQQAVGVNSNHPLAGRVAFLWSGATPRYESLYGTAGITDNDGAPQAVGLAGLGVAAGANANSKLRWLMQGSTGNSYTAFTVVTDTVGRGALRIPFSTDNPADIRRLQIRISATNQAEITVFDTTGTAVNIAGGSVSAGLNVIAARVNGTAISVWLNGVNTASGTLAAAAQSHTVGSTIAVGNLASPATAAQPMRGPIHLCVLINGALSDSEMVLYGNPQGLPLLWQLFAPYQQRIWPGVLGGDYTLNAETGAYTFTGSNATLLKGLIIEAASGGYTLTGSNATFVYNKLLNASSGSYSVSGADANLIYTPGSGAYVLSADSGACLLTGSDVTFAYSGGTITLKAGSWVRYRIIT